jgi:hypothetical protein
VAAASLLLLGLIFGLVVALYYAWMVEPVSYVAAGPYRLSEEYKTEYILLISQSYAADSNWDRALIRLESLNDPDIADTVSLQLEQHLREGEPAHVLSNLAIVAEKLGSRSQAVALFVPLGDDSAATVPAQVQIPPASTLLPAPTGTTRATSAATPSNTPTDEPTPTPVSAFKLLKRERICRRNTPIPLLEVVVYDAFLDPIQGVEVLVHWDAGSDHFFTGYHPDLGAGYGDFAMEPETTYSVEVAIGSTLVDGLQIENCGEELGGFAGGWRLTYQVSDAQEDSEES